MESIFKQVYRYTHARVLRHNENFWPHIRIARSDYGNIQRLSWRGQNIPLLDLNELRATASGDMTILATGPSVKSLALPKLVSTTFMGVNGAYHLRGKVKFTWYVIVDRGFVNDRFDVVADVLSDPELVLFTTVHCLNDMLKRIDLRRITCRLAIIEDLSFKIFQGKVKPQEYASHYSDRHGLVLFPTEPCSGFSWDIRQGIFDAGTVAYWALQLSPWLGAERIFLAGVDMSDFSSPRFYESQHDKLPSFLETNFPTVIQPAFFHASRELSRAGIKTYNLSLKSGLGDDIFPRVTPDAIFE